MDAFARKGDLHTIVECLDILGEGNNLSFRRSDSGTQKQLSADTQKPDRPRYPGICGGGSQWCRRVQKVTAKWDCHPMRCGSSAVDVVHMVTSVNVIFLKVL